MKLKLNEIPDEGREYIYTKETGELNEDLRDLIENNQYHVQFFIKPLNHKDFVMNGTVTTKTKEICSLCGETFHFPTKAKINEIIIPKTTDKDHEKQSRANHISEQDENAPSVSEYKGEVFEIGDFVHEAVALSIPFNPKPELTEKGDCSVCLKSLLSSPFVYDENISIVEKINPFSALKDLKLKNSKPN
jgi:uncharacterized protein